MTVRQYIPLPHCHVYPKFVLPFVCKARSQGQPWEMERYQETEAWAKKGDPRKMWILECCPERSSLDKTIRTGWGQYKDTVCLGRKLYLESAELSCETQCLSFSVAERFCSAQTAFSEIFRILKNLPRKKGHFLFLEQSDMIQQ